MGLKNRISKFSGKMTKEKWLLLLLGGGLLMILSFPLPGSRRTGKDGESQSGQVSRNEGAVPLWTGDAQENDQDAEPDQASLNGPGQDGDGPDSVYPASASAGGEGSYETQMEYSQITAPIDGLVEICDMEPYDTVSQSNLICVISGRGSRVVSFSATERIRGYLQEGDTIQVEKDGGSYQGTIYEISTMADETTGLYKVKASMDEDTFLSTGSEVKLYVTSEETTNAMTIPVDAVYYEDGEPYVYVYTDGKVHKRDIESGIYDSNTMEVRSGLTLDDQVVTTWSSELYEGAEVILKNQEEDGQ